MSHKNMSALNIRFNRVLTDKGHPETDLAWENGRYVKDEIELLFKGFVMGHHSVTNSAGCFVVVPHEAGRFRFRENLQVFTSSVDADLKMKRLAEQNKGITYALFTKIKSFHIKK